MLHIVLMIMPANRFMLHHEQVAPMCVKHRATLTLCYLYGAVAVITVISTPLLLTGLINDFNIPLAPVGMICIAVQFLPHKWIMPLAHLEELYTYYRVRRLERRVVALAGSTPIPLEPFNWRDQARLEIAIYALIISIQDYYRLAAQTADTEGKALCQEIDRLSALHDDHQSLARAMARVQL